MIPTTVLKKAMLFTLVICMLTGLCGALASADGTPTVEIGTVSTSSGETIQVPVTVSDLSDIYAVQFAVSYDADKLELLSAVKGSAMPSDTAPTINAATAGKVYFVWETVSTALSGDGPILVMEFKVKDAALGEASITFAEGEEFIFCDENYSDVAPTAAPGTVTITEPQPTSYDAQILGMNGYFADFYALNLYVKTDVENPSFDLVRGETALSQVTNRDIFCSSRQSVYYVEKVSGGGMNALGLKSTRSEECWMITIKIFTKFLATPVTLTVRDGEKVLNVLGYSYNGFGSSGIATSHDYSFIDYTEIMASYLQTEAWIGLNDGLKAAAVGVNGI